MQIDYIQSKEKHKQDIKQPCKIKKSIIKVMSGMSRRGGGGGKRQWILW